MILTLFLFYFGILIVFIIILIIVLATSGKETISYQGEYPYISILLAVRNEENNIIRCLWALEQLDYPKEKIEILIGDDQSEDNTVQVITQYMADKRNYYLYHISEKRGLAGAKGNVIGQLARKATSDIFFITDADVSVPRSWIKGLLMHNNPEVAIVSGCAVMDGHSLLAKLQCIDWITAFGMIFTAVRVGIPVTAVGNNMMVNKKPYLETGGFENIPFSVTEDFDLHEATRKLGWKNKNLLNPLILTRTLPIKGLNNLLQQRKRWMKGAVRLPWYLVSLLSLYALFFPFLLICLWIAPGIAITAWVAKFLLQNIYLSVILCKVKYSYRLLLFSIIYEVYSGLCSFILIIYYFLPLKTDWKGRKYE